MKIDKKFISIILLAMLSVVNATNFISQEHSSFEGDSVPEGVIPMWGSAATATVDDEDSYSGLRSLKLKLDGGQAKGVFIPVGNGPFLKGSTYTASAWLKSSISQPYNIYIWGSDKLWDRKFDRFSYKNIGNDWTQISVTYTLPEDANIIGILINGSKPGELWIDQVKFEPGSQATIEARNRTQDAVPAAPKNLLPENCSTFESGVPDSITVMWDNPGALAINSDQSYTGKSALEFSLSEGSKAIFIPIPDQEFKAGEVISASAYLRSDENGPVNIYLWGADKLWESTFQDFRYDNVGKEWKQFKITSKLPRDIKILGVLITASPSQIKKLYIDEVKVEKAPVASITRPNRISGGKIDKNLLSTLAFLAEPIDSLDDPAWSNATVIDRFFLTDGSKKTAPESTRLSLAADRNYLYAKFLCQLPGADKIKLGSSTNNPDWNDERIELHFSLAGHKLKAQPDFISINADGVPYGNHHFSSEELNIQTRRHKEAYEVAFRIPLRKLGIEGAPGLLGRISGGRFHRTNFTGASSIGAINGHFGSVPEAFRYFVVGSGQLPEIFMSDCGMMAEYANSSGGNVMMFQFDHPVNPENYTLFINGQKHAAAKGSSQDVLKFFYTVSGLSDEELDFELRNQAGQIQMQGKFAVGRFKPDSRVFPTPDPVHTELYGQQRTRPRPMISWSQVVHPDNIDKALKTGVEYSLPAVHRKLKSANISIMTIDAFDIYENLPSRRKGNYYVDRSPVDMRYLAAGVKDGSSLPATIYSSYMISGQNEQGQLGITASLDGYFGIAVDPINRNAYLDSIRALMNQYRNEVGYFFFGDELVTITTGKGLLAFADFNRKLPGNFLEKWNDDVKNTEGGGRFGIPWNIDPKDPSYPYSFRAYYAYMADNLSALGKEAREIVKKANDKIIVLSDDAYGVPSTHGVQYWHQYADVGTFQIGEGGGSSSKDFPSYMFTTKMVRDLSGLDELIVVPHEAVDGYPSGAVGADEMLELYSQVLRGGATGLHFWPASMGGKDFRPDNAPSVTIGYPLAWEYMIETSKFLNGMPELKFPENIESAVLVSDDSLLIDSSKYNTFREIFTQLGVRPHGWFDFVSDSHIVLGKIDLDQYKLLYVPYASVLKKATVDKLMTFVRNGGTLICSDVDFAGQNIFGESTGKIRETLFGITAVGTTENKVKLDGVDFIVPKESSKLKIVGDNVKVTGTYSDGSPAVTEYVLGKGRAIFFGFQLFSPEITRQADATKWIEKFHVRLGGSINHPIWRFKLSNLNVKRPDLPKGECLTGNFGFWDRHFFQSGDMQNLSEQGSYSVGKNGKVNKFDFGKGKLTDRLSFFDRVGEYKSGDVNAWVEKFKSGSHNIAFDLKKTTLISNLILYCAGDLPEIQVEYADGGKMTQLTTVVSENIGNTTVKKITIPINKKTDQIKLNFKLDSGRELTVAEVELWNE